MFVANNNVLSLTILNSDVVSLITLVKSLIGHIELQ